MKKNNLLLIWISSGSVRFFLLPEANLSKSELSTLREVAGETFRHDMEDSLCDKLWYVKAAVSSEGDFIPTDVPTMWHHKYLKSEVDLPIRSANISEVISVGSKVRS